MKDKPTLRALREARYMTQEDLARAAEVGVFTISRFESGNYPHKPRFRTIKRLATALGVEPEQIARLVAA